VLSLSGGAGAQSLETAAPAAEQPVPLRLSRQLNINARPDGESHPAMVLNADQLTSRIDQETVAQGKAELRYGDLLLRADTLRYDETQDLAHADGHVEISHSGSVVKGPSLQLYVQRFEGEILNPNYFFSATGGGGHADSLRFLDSSRIRAERATYSSCPVTEEHPEPAWQLSTSSLSMNFEANEGVATDAVLRFQGVPILAAPSLSFPLGEGRKSGWLPPVIGLDNRSGFEFGLPYYWNIAPQRDATFTPYVMTQRGAGMASEFRYLEPGQSGMLNLDLLPHDRLMGRGRWDFRLNMDGNVGDGWSYKSRVEQVSDDDYWIDMPSRMKSATPRLLPTDFQLSKSSSFNWAQVQTYARVEYWQALQGLDPTVQFATPFQRTPQVGLRLNSSADDVVLMGYRPWGRPAQLEGGLELEYNRFTRPLEHLISDPDGGERVHLLSHVSLPLGGSAWWLVPKLSVNMAAYSLDTPIADGQTRMYRGIPTFSLDNGWVFERDTSLLGHSMVQSLEPRAMYVLTPYVAQSQFPQFDSAPKDFNFDSIYAENQFSGVDRVSDANQLTLGVTSRWLDTELGDEVLRLGLAQRLLFSPQNVTPDNVPVNSHVSDLLLLGSTHLDKRWWLDGTLEYNSSTNEVAREVLGARYSPGPFRTVSAAYRLTRNQSEQVEVAWQWPLSGQVEPPAPRASGAASCGGAWYSAGRLQYSLYDRRLINSVMGFEYNAGCWILRLGAERLSTGQASTNTSFLVQIELVGLSTLGSNALQVLKDNIPGYRSLSSDRSANSRSSYD